MNSAAEKLNYCAKNADVQEEFIGIMKNPQSKDYWENYIRMRLKTGIIGRYLKLCTAEDILGELTLKIFEKEIVWNRDVYKDFKKFMYGQIQNIMRDIERKLQNKIEELNSDEGEETLYTAEPKHDGNFMENIVELNTDSFGKDLLDRKDKFAYYKSNFEGQFDPGRFNETVLVILKHPNDTELLAVYTGYVAKKKRREIMAEYGFTLLQYQRIWKRLLYKLRNELPREYKNMLSTSMIMHLLYNFYRNMPKQFL
jgi:hypothetical protein